MSSVRPQGDPGVVTAAGLVTTNSNSLMLAKYGLTAMAELCSPQKQKYRENALEALNVASFFDALNTLASKLEGAKHESQAQSIAVILNAIFKACQLYPGAGFEQVVAQSNVAHTMSLLAQCGVQDETFTRELADAADYGCAAGLFAGVDPKSLTELAESISSLPATTEESRLSVRMGVCSLVGSGGGTPAVYDKMTKDVAHSLGSCEGRMRDSCIRYMTAAAGYVVDHFDTRTKCSMLPSMNQVLKTGNASQRDQMQKIRYSLFTKEEFQGALATLSDTSQSGESVIDAYHILDALAGNPEYIDIIVNEGWLPTLLGVLPGAAARLATSRESEAMGIASLCHLLSTVARKNDSNVSLLISSGALDAINGAMSCMDLSADCESIANVADFLSTLCTTEEVCNQCVDSGTVTTVLNVISNSCHMPEFGSGCVALIDRMSDMRAIAPRLNETGAVEILMFASGHRLTDVQYQKSLWHAILNIIPFSHSLENAGSCGDSVGHSLNFSVGNPTIAEPLIKSLLIASKKTQCASLFNGTLVNNLCLVALVSRHMRHDLGLEADAREILAAVASDADVQRVAEGAAMANFAADVHSAMAEAAACGVLPTLPHLQGKGDVTASAIFNNLSQTVGLGETIDSSFKNLFKTDAAPLSGDVLFAIAALAAAEAIAGSTPAGVNASIHQHIQLIKTGISGLVGTENQCIGFAMDSLTRSFQNDITDPTACSEVSAGLSEFFAFDSYPSVMTHALSSMAQFCGQDGGIAADAFFNDGKGPADLTKAVARFKFSPRPLAPALTAVRYQLTNTVTVSRDDAVAAFRSCGILTSILAAVKTTRSKRVALEASKVIPLLMTEREASDIAKDLVARIRAAIKKQDIENLTNVLIEASGYCASMHVSRHFLNNKGGELLHEFHLNPFAAETSCFKACADTCGAIASHGSTAEKCRSIGLFEDMCRICVSGGGNELIARCFYAMRNIACADLKSKDAMGATEAGTFATYQLLDVGAHFLEQHASHSSADDIRSLFRHFARLDGTTSYFVTPITQTAVVSCVNTITSGEGDVEGMTGLLGALLFGGSTELANHAVEHDTMQSIYLDLSTELSECADTMANYNTAPAMILDALAGLAMSTGAAEAKQRQGVMNRDLGESIAHHLGSAADAPMVALCLRAFDRNCASGDPAIPQMFTKRNFLDSYARYKKDTEVAAEYENLKNKMPSVGPEVALLIAQILDANTAGDTDGVHNGLIALHVMMVRPVLDPETNLARANELIALVNTVDNEAAQMVMEFAHNLAVDYKDHQFGYAIGEGLSKYLAILHKADPMSTNPNMVRAAADCLTSLGYNPADDARDGMCNAHAASPVDLTLLSEFKNDREALNSIVDFCGALVANDSNAAIHPIISSSTWTQRLNELYIQSVKQNDFEMSYKVLGVLGEYGNVIGCNESHAALHTSVVKSVLSADLENIDNIVLSALSFANALLASNVFYSSQALAILDACKARAGDLTSPEILGSFVDVLAQFAGINPAEFAASGLLDMVWSSLDIEGDPDFIRRVIGLLSTLSATPELEGFLKIQDLMNMTNPFAATKPLWMLDRDSVSQYMDMLNNLLALHPEYRDEMYDEFLARLAEMYQDYPDLDCWNKFKELTTDFVDPDGNTVSINIEGGPLRIIEELALEGAPPPDTMTLRKVYAYLKDRLQKGLNISPLKESDPADQGTLQGHLDLMWDRMSAHSSEPVLNPRMFPGDEIKWGALCIELWCQEDPDLVTTMLEWQILDVILVSNILAQQGNGVAKDTILCTPSAQAINAIAYTTEPGGRVLGGIEGIDVILTNSLNVCLNDDVLYNSQRNLLPRIKNVEVAAIDRNVFKTVDVIYALDVCWQYFAQGALDRVALAQIFRSLRRVTNSDNVKDVGDLNFIPRTIQELHNATENTVLSDGYYFLGVCSSTAENRPVAWENGGTTIAVKQLKEHLDDGFNVGVLTNIMNALSNMVVGYTPADDEFIDLGGMETVVWVLRNRLESPFEIASAAALVANSSFRRDDVKARYGDEEINAPAAMADAIAYYIGQTGPAAQRAIIALLKGIANLALFAPNVLVMCENGVPDVYYQIFSSYQSLPDPVMYSAFVTLNNLCLEYTPFVLDQFNCIIDYIIASGTTMDRGIEMNALMFDALASLARTTDNALNIVNSGGLDWAMMSLTSINVTADQPSIVLKYIRGALGVIGSCCKDSYEISEMAIQKGVFNIINSVLGGNYWVSGGDDAEVDLCAILQMECQLMCWRILRRLTSAYGWATTWSEYLSTGGFDSFVWAMQAETEYDPVRHQMVEEILSCLVGWLAVCGPYGQSIITQESTVVKAVVTDDKSLMNSSGDAIEEYQLGRGDFIAPASTPLVMMGLTLPTVANVLELVSMLAEMSADRKSPKVVQFALSAINVILHQCYAIGTGAPCEFGKNDILEQLCDGEYKYVLEHIEKRISVILELMPEPNDTIWELIFQLVFNFGFASGNLTLWNADSRFWGTVQRVSQKLGTTQRASVANLLDAWKTAAKKPKHCVSTVSPYVALWNDLDSYTGWSHDAYPNGVQDLPYKMELREGGQFEIIAQTGTSLDKAVAYWCGNKSLKMFQWQIKGTERRKAPPSRAKPSHFGENGSEGQIDLSVITLPGVQLSQMEFTNYVPIVKVHCLKGPLLPQFRNFVGGVSNPSSDRCLTFHIGACDCLPEGGNIAVICSSKRERDTMFKLMNEWKDAALSN